LYSGRMYKLSFFGKYRGQNKVHESGALMLIPLIILAICATFFGFFGFSHDLAHTLHLEIPHALENHFQNYFVHTKTFRGLISENVLSLSPTILSILGLTLAFKLLSQKEKNSKTLENNFFSDEIANTIIVKPFTFFQKFIYA